MKRKLVDIAIVLVLLTMVAFYVRAPLHRGYLGPVSMALKGYQTNTTGQIAAFVSITNEGLQPVDFAVGTQILRAAEWVDPSSTVSNHFNLTLLPDPHIAARTNKLVSLPIPPPPCSWRIRLMYQKSYPEHWSKKLRWISD